MYFKLRDVYNFNNDYADDDVKHLTNLKKKLKNICANYGVVYQITTGTRNTQYVDSDIFLVFLMEISIQCKYPYILDYQEQILNFRSDSIQTPSNMEILEKAQAIFNSMQNSDQLNFLHNLYSTGSKLVKAKSLL